MTRPLIGLSCRFDPKEKSDYLEDDYARAVYHSGGDPVLIPRIEDRAYIQRIAQHLDGLLLPGSDTDVDPQRYGQSPGPHLGPIDVVRDTVDSTLLEIADARKTPVLAICYGVQILNVTLGGTLIQDIPSTIETEIRHRRENRQESIPTHPLILAQESSLLAALAAQKKVLVNSSHHQALDEIAPQLEVLAWAPDGIVEAVRLNDSSHFVLGVQWHPERDFEDQPFSQAIFRKFVEYAKIARSKKE